MAKIAGRVGILVGGGPAPGINSVISSATIRARLAGLEVLGLQDGFKWIMESDTGHTVPLTIDTVSRVHFRGGSIIGTARANPTRQAAHLENSIQSLLDLGLRYLVTIGGDDTAFSAMKLAEKAAGRIAVVHVPKTIDNDLDLPAPVDTFGYQTARHLGTQIVKNMMVDARTTSRWYLLVAMGRKAGHLALGIGKAAGATLTLIPEEFGAEPVSLQTLTDTLVGAVIKRRASGRLDGVAMLAEGLALAVDPADIEQIADAERDAHGHVRIAEIKIGEILKNSVRDRLKELGCPTTVVAKDIGYELRCADPIPYDLEYTRDLGHCAAQSLIDGRSGVMVTMQGGSFIPVPFEEMLDPETGKTRVRLVDVESTRYAIALRYMIRLRQEDFDDPAELARMTEACGLDEASFRERFQPLAVNASSVLPTVG